MKRTLALASAASLMIMSCQPPQQVTVDRFRLSGNVMVPEPDQSIQPMQTSLNPLSLFMQEAQAATGLKSVDAGVEVRLIRIDDEGRPVSSEPLATTSTRADGSYELDVDPGLVTLPSTDLVVEVGNYASGNYLRNFVTQEQLDLTPVTTALVQYIVDRSEPLFSLPTSVIEEARTLSAQSTANVDYGSVNLSNALSNTLTSLKANATLTTRIDQLLSRVVSGRVLAPNGRIAAAPIRLDSFLAPPAEALTGLQAVSSNITVTLSQIDNNGNVVGLPLATTKTRSDGSYSIVLPSQAQMTSEYIVSVGSGPSQMRAMLSGSSQLDISPLSEMTTRLILNNGTVLSQPKVPITEFDPPEIIAVLDAVQRATASTTLGGASSVSAVLGIIEPVVTNDSVVRNNLNVAGGIPAPAVNNISSVTDQDSVVLSGTARAGAIVRVTGGTQIVSQALPAGESNFSIRVPLKRNSAHDLQVQSIIGSEISLPNTVSIRTDTLNPQIDTSKIIARNPSGQSFETIITGSTGAIIDNGRATVVITGPKLGNATRIQTNESGAFEARLAADSGDVLNLQVIDEADNSASAQIVVGGPGPVVTSVMQESTISRDAPFAKRVITIEGAGFDSSLAANLVTFTSSAGSVSTSPRSVSSDRRTMVVAVPDGLAANLSQYPNTVSVQVTVGGIPSNDNRDFILFPKVTQLTAANVNSNGKSEHFHFDPVRNNSFFTQQVGTASSVSNLDNNGNILKRNLAEDITHDSIFRDATIDNDGNMLVSNFDATLVGKPRELPDIRPSYRVSRYRLQGTNAELAMTERISESPELGSMPGAIAFGRTNNQIYVALPQQGRILKMNFAGGVFGRPEVLASGLPTPIRDLVLSPEDRFLYVSLGESVSVFKLTLNAQGEVDLLNSNYAKDMGNGNGHMALDEFNNLYITLGTGIERISETGSRTNLIPIAEGQQPSVGIVYVNNQLITSQLNQPDLLRITP